MSQARPGADYDPSFNNGAPYQGTGYITPHESGPYAAPYPSPDNPMPPGGMAPYPAPYPAPYQAPYPGPMPDGAQPMPPPGPPMGGPGPIGFDAGAPAGYQPPPPMPEYPGGSSHQSSAGQATGSGNQTNWDRQGARPKHQTTASSTMEATLAENCQFPLNYEESWDNVKVEIQMKGKLVPYDFGGDLILPFTVQYLCSSINLKHEVEVLTDNLILKEIKENLLVLEMKFDKTGDQADQLGDEVYTILKTVFEGYSAYQFSEKDFCLLVDYSSKSPEVRFYRYKGQMYICGKKTSIKGIHTKLQYPREEVQIHKDAMLLFREYNYFKKLSSNGVTIIPMNDEAVVVTCSDKGMMQEAVDSLRKGQAEVDSLHLQGVLVTKDLNQKFIDRQVKVIASETGEVKLIIRKNQKPEIEKMMKEWISAMFGQNAQASNNNQPKPHDVYQSDENQGPEFPKKLRQNKQVDTDEEIWTCNSGLCTYLKQQGSNIIESLQKKNVTIEIGLNEIKLRGSKKNIHTAVLGLKLQVISSTVEVPNDGGSLCHWATSSAGREALDRITASQGCGWTLMPCSSMHETRKGVLPLATWTLTTPRQTNHCLSVCVVEDVGQTDLKDIIIPVFTDQTPLHNVATMRLGELIPSYQRQMRHGECITKWTKSYDRKIILIALAEKMIENQMETLTVPDDKGLEKYFSEMLKRVNTQRYAFVVPQSSDFTDCERLMQSLVMSFHRKNRENDYSSQEMMLYCSNKDEASYLLNVLHNLCCKKMFGTFGCPVLMSRNTSLDIVPSSLLQLKADCIVVMVSRHLEIKGTIPEQLLKLVGPNLQGLIRDSHPASMADGECLFLTLPEPLPSGIKSVIFGFLPICKTNGHVETLRQFIQSCLHTAAISGCSSLGFPAIGTGYLGYPQLSVTTIMFDTVEQFSREAICAELESVMVAIVDQTDPMWEMMTSEKKRRNHMTQIGIRHCQEFLSLQTTTSKGVHVKVVTKDSLLWPLSSDWVLMEFIVNKEKSQKSEINFCPYSDEFEWNMRVEVFCSDSANILKEQMESVIPKCEEGKITYLAITCSHSFSLAISCQVEIIIEALNKAYTSYLSNVMIVTPDETGLKNVEHVLLKPTGWSLRSKPVWQKEAGEPCHNIIVFGQSRKAMQAVKSIQQKKSKVHACHPLKDTPESGEGQEGDDGTDKVHGSLPPPLKESDRYPDNSLKPHDGSSGNNQGTPAVQYPPGVPVYPDSNQLASLTSKEKPAEEEPPICKDGIESLFIDGEAVSFINSTVLAQMKASGQTNLKLANIEKDFGVKFKQWGNETIFCGSLNEVSEVEQFLWNQFSNEAFSLKINEDEHRKHCCQPSLGTFSNTQEEGQSGRNIDSMEWQTDEEKTSVVVSGLNILAYTQNILQTKVDAIVRPTNEFMDSKLGLAKVIADSAGVVMVNDCRDFVSKHGKLKETQCRVTKAGDLDFSYIIHVNCPNEKNNFASNLKTSVLNCLRTADNFEMTSLVIPLIGTGFGSQDITLCVEQYLKSLKEFINEKRDSKLKEIHFVDKDQGKITILAKELKNMQWNQGPGCVKDKRQINQGENKESSQEDNKQCRERDNSFDSHGSHSDNRHSCQSDQIQCCHRSLSQRNQRDNKQCHSGCGQGSHREDKKNSPPDAFDISSCNVRVSISHYDITALSVDAIVCPQDENLSKKGMIATAILKLVGETHKEKLEKERKHKHIIGDIVLIAPEGDIPCKTVMYAVSPYWTHKYTQKPTYFEKDITTTVQECLRMVYSRDFKSIAFPLLGMSDDEASRPTPVPTCCKGMITGILQFCTDCQSLSSTPLHIHLVSTDQGVIAAFKEELKMQMSSNKVLNVRSNQTPPNMSFTDQDGKPWVETCL